MLWFSWNLTNNKECGYLHENEAGFQWHQTNLAELKPRHEWRCGCTDTYSEDKCESLTTLNLISTTPIKQLNK